jgi:hypothetical protein
MESAMSFPQYSALAAVALAAALTGAQAQPTQEQDHAARRHAGQVMTQAHGPAMGRQGNQMMMGGDRAAMMAMMQPRHIEGRIAFLKTELKITDAQSQQWNAFADALRENARAMTTIHDQMMHDGTTASAPEQAAHEVKVLSMRLD